MNQLTILAASIKTADTHAHRLTIGLTHLEPLFPFTVEALDTISDENLGYLELLTGRFAKLQDVIGSKIFPALLSVLQENKENLSMLDRLNKLEKLEIIESVHGWIEMRDVRNMVTHDYPEYGLIVCKNLDIIREHAIALVAYWQSLRTKIFEIVKTLPQ